MTDFEDRFFALLTEVMDLIGRTEEEALRVGEFTNLSRSEMHTLKNIGLYDTKTMGETAAQLNVTTGTLSVQIDRLVKKNYVIRQRREEDRRVVELKLSKKGKLAYRMHDRFNRLLLENILEPLDSEGQEALYQTLARVQDYLEEQHTKYTARKAEKKQKEKENV